MIEISCHHNGGNMSTPAIRAALERLIELDKGIQGISGIPVDDWTDAIAAARAALAQPEGEGPSDEAPYEDAPVWSGSRDAAAWQAGRQNGWSVALARWGRPTALPAPDAGELGELVTFLTVASSCGGGAALSPEQCRRAATLLQQFSAITTEDLKND